MNSRNAIRFLQVSLAVLALLVFALVVSSGLHHHDSTDDSHCPYCSLKHQSAAEPENNQAAAELSPVASVLLSIDLPFFACPVFSPASSRAPPAA